MVSSEKNVKMRRTGINKADIYERLLSSVSKNNTNNDICVFLSHKREDKSACIKIANYLKEANINYYLDIEDEGLQIASNNSDPEKITESIKNGIKNSTHMLVVISEKTYLSKWVPFEVGYGHSAIIDQKPLNSKINLAVLTLSDISEKQLPDYLQIAYQIRGTKSLNEYISKISNTLEKSLINESRIFSHSHLKHPLDSILNWQL